jgi:D-sedoheptulose 7-phosphate isomerase
MTHGALSAAGPRPAAPVRPARTTADAVSAEQLFLARAAPMRDLARQADAVASACHAMAERFHTGAKLVAFGTGTASTDAQHVAVEFVHPVIVGKRALPAISLTTDIATVTGVATRDGMAEIFARQIRSLGEPADIALGIAPDGRSASILAGLTAAHELGMLTIALAGGTEGAAGPVAASPAVDHVLLAASADPLIVKEVQVTTYHVLWELVHVFFEQPGVLGPGVVT